MTPKPAARRRGIPYRIPKEELKSGGKFNLE